MEMARSEESSFFTLDDKGGCGLVVANTHPIRLFLQSISQDKSDVLPDSIRNLASDLSSQKNVLYRDLIGIWSSSLPLKRPKLNDIFAGTSFVFSSPKPREKSKELKDRLSKLQDLAERRAYRELVKDVVPKEDTVEPFSSYKDQLGFGLHVVLIMFTGFLFGYAAFRALFDHSAAMNAAGGIFGMVCGMLLETVLFIVRASNLVDPTAASSTNLKKKKKCQ